MKNTISFPCIKVTQPIGTFFIGSIPSKDLCEITWVDVRRIEGDRGFETYIGIQRPLSKNRVKELSQYVTTPDACFPTSVILAIPGVCVTYNSGIMTLSEYIDEEDGDNNIPFKQIAEVIDGQHRIEGLRRYETGNFEVNVSIFVDMDVADQAYLFSTVNLAQTKVNRSLVYDLFDLAKTRSPQKTCHAMAVALDKHKDSPFHERIKRLGVSTEGRFNETITQATFVQALLAYISSDPLTDRSTYLNKKKPPLATADDLQKLIFRNMFLQEKDLDITDVIWNYFDAVRERWPDAWSTFGRGIMLNKTNGFRGLMRLLRPTYLHIVDPGKVPTVEEFLNLLQQARLEDKDFTIERFVPGTSGESMLFKTLKSEIGL